VTASNVAAVKAKGSGATRQNYMTRMACEIMSGEPTKTFKSAYMQRGNDCESTARMIYEQIKGVTVAQAPFYYIEEERLGASLDGEAGDDGSIEIKTVLSSEQVRLITTGKIKDAYIKQMQTQMYVREKLWCDYVSYAPGDDESGELPDRHKIVIIRVPRDDDMILRIRKEVAFFHHDLQKMLEKLR
jgi:hypothetical protein